MAETGFFRYKDIGIIIIILFILAVFSLWIRMLPLFGPEDADILNIVGRMTPSITYGRSSMTSRQFPWIQLV